MLLLETVTYIATRETGTCIIPIEIVMCIMHCRKYYLHDCDKKIHQIFVTKCTTNIIAREPKKPA